MLVGGSLSKCVIDIYDGKVDISQVLVINSGTCVDTVANVDKLFDSYCNGSFFGHGPWEGYDRDRLMSIVNELLFTGRWVQERVFTKLDIGFMPDHIERSGKIHRDGASHWTVYK